MGKPTKDERINELEEELCYMDGLFFDLGKWKLSFLEYIEEKKKTDKKNIKIYDEILKKCQLLFDII